MKTLTLSLIAAVYLLAPAVLRGADANDSDDPATKEAIAWIKAHDKYKGKADTLNSAMESVKAAQKKGQNANLNIPATVSDTGYEQVWLIDGTFQHFHLTEAQAKNMFFIDQTIPTYIGNRVEKISDKPVAELSDLVIDNAAAIDGSKRITGSVSCKTLAQPSGKYVIRIWYIDHKSPRSARKPGMEATKIYNLPGKLPENGTVKFFFDLNDSPKLAQGYNGGLVVFVSLCKLTAGPHGTEQTLFSNNLGTLINIKGK